MTIMTTAVCTIDTRVPFCVDGNVPFCGRGKKMSRSCKAQGQHGKVDYEGCEDCSRIHCHRVLRNASSNDD